MYLPLAAKVFIGASSPIWTSEISSSLADTALGKIKIWNWFALNNSLVSRQRPLLLCFRWIHKQHWQDYTLPKNCSLVFLQGSRLFCWLLTTKDLQYLRLACLAAVMTHWQIMMNFKFMKGNTDKERTIRTRATDCKELESGSLSNGLKNIAWTPSESLVLCREGMKVILFNTAQRILMLSPLAHKQYQPNQTSLLSMILKHGSQKGLSPLWKKEGFSKGSLQVYI